MEIKRDYYLNQLISSKGNGMIKVITGIRRCGKSYLLNNLFYNYLLQNNVDFDHIIKFSFDSAEDLKMIGEDPFKFSDPNAKVDPNKFMHYIKLRFNDSKTYYLLLDEIQLLGAFEFVLNSYLRHSNIEVYVTGSNAKFLSKDIITEFAGRGWQIQIFPLSFKEYYDAIGGDKLQLLQQYMLYGGLPALINFSDKDKISYLKNLYKETYIKDVINRNKIVDEAPIEALLNTVSSSVGCLTNPSKLERAFKSIGNITLSTPTISKYLELLCDAFILNVAKRYDIKGKMYMSTPFKYYFTDLGLRNASIDFRQVEYTHLLENLVYIELLRRGYSVDVGNIEKQETINGKYTRSQLKVDFVCNLGDKRLYIQVAYSIPDEAKIAQEKKSLLTIKDNFKKIIITMDYLQHLHYNNDGILIMNIYDFLFDENSIEY